jgi:hypothetical protein
MDALKQKVFEAVEKVSAVTSEFKRANKEGYTAHEIRLLLDSFPEINPSDFGAYLIKTEVIVLPAGEVIYHPSEVENALYSVLIPKK